MIFFSFFFSLTGDESPTALSVQVLCNVYLLAEADVFVSTLSLELPRVVAALSRSDSQHKEIVSLDVTDVAQYSSCIM